MTPYDGGTRILGVRYPQIVFEPGVQPATPGVAYRCAICGWCLTADGSGDLRHVRIISDCRQKDVVFSFSFDEDGALKCQYREEKS